MAVVFAVLTLAFVAVEVLPQDPARIFLPRGCSLPDTCRTLLRDLNEQWGLNQPLLNRYALFLSNLLLGNFGISTTVRPGTSVASLITPALGTTLEMVGLALLFAAIVSLAVGMPLGRRRGSVSDAVVSFGLAVPISLTVVPLALAAAYAYFTSPSYLGGPDPTLRAAYQLVAAGIVAASVAGLYTWMVRDYPLVRAPGLPGDRPRDPRRRSAETLLVRFLATLPPLLPWTVGAALLVDALMSLGGLGFLLSVATLNLDVFLILGIFTTMAVLVLLPAIVAADILHVWLARDDGRLDAPRSWDAEPDGRDLLRVPVQVGGTALGLGGTVLMVLLVGMGILAPFLAGPYPTPFTLARPNVLPGGTYPLGTDARGQSNAVLLMYGVLPEIPVAILAFAIALGTCLAIVAALGLFGARARWILHPALDAALILSFPFVAVLYLATFGVSVFALPALVSCPVAARILLLETEGLVDPTPRKGQPVGRRTLGLVWATGPLIVGDSLLAVSLALATAASMDMIGLTTTGPGILSWGGLVFQSYLYLEFLNGHWWDYLPPILGIFAAVLAPLLLALAVKRVGLLPLRGTGSATPASEGLDAEAVPTR